MNIEDGTGKGYQAEVDSENRLKTFAINITEHHKKSIDGKGFTMGTTEKISLSGTNESSVLFFKNNDDNDIVVTKMVALTSGTTEPTGVAIVRNPRSMTPDTGNIGGLLTNNNFGSSNAPNVTIIDGIDGATFESNDVWNFYTVEGAYFTVLGPFVVPKGSSFGVTITPPNNNANMTINLGFEFYENGIGI